MNIYDPMDRMVYRHVDQQPDSRAVPVMGTRSINQLPSGYANRSPLTYLGRTRRTPQAA